MEPEYEPAKPSGRMKWIVVLVGVIACVILGVRYLGTMKTVHSAEVEAPPAATPAPAARPVATAPPASPALAATPVTAEPTPAPPPAPAATSAAKPALQLRARLLPSGGGTLALKGTAGIARISEEDAAEYRMWLEAGAQGAGPSSLIELANVREWLPAPVTPAEGGAAVFGPIEVPEAPLYRILAWAADGRYYLRDFELPELLPADRVLDAGDIAVTTPTGIRVTVVNNTPGEPSYLLQLGRAPDQLTAEDASRTAPIIERVSPELATAFMEDLPLPIAAEEPLEIVPVFPDPAIRLTLLTLTGTAAEQVTVPLEIGRIKDVQLDAGAAFGANKIGFIDLHGKLVRGGKAEEPLAGVPLDRMDSPIPSRQVTAEDGTFLFPALPRERPTSFLVAIEAPASARPISPRQTVFTFDPKGEGVTADAQEAEVIWHVPVYQWLVLDVSRETHEGLRAALQVPYPIYILQELDESANDWRDSPGDEFLIEDSGVAVSIVREGVYRVAMARTPLDVTPSEAAAITPGDGEVHASIDLSRPDARKITVEVRENGMVVPGARIYAVGSSRGLPPLEGQTDNQGRFALGEVSVSYFTIGIRTANGEFERRIEDAQYAETHVLDVAAE
ncbi:hypothetical protein HZA57_02970 [Candidatus Poribacteria bacterium]|nr:hypothetical protein [Candidatus Poribacteria bacterium]